MMDGTIALPPDEFRAQLQRAGIGQDKPLHSVLIAVFEAAQIARGVVQEGRRPWTRDELRELITQIDATLLHRWSQFNRVAVAILVAVTVAFGGVCGVGGYLFRGAAPALVGVRAGADQCQDRPDGSRLCWIPVFERLSERHQ